MAKPSKKQSLLGQTQPPKKKRPSNSKNRRPSPQQAAAIKAQQAAALQAQQAAMESEKPKSKTKWLVAAVLAVVFILFPKPQLITYEKLGLVAESVYWPGLPGVSPMLFDSNLHAKSAMDRNTLYLCHDLQNPDSCQKYKVIKQQGFMAAMIKLVSG